MEEQVSAERGRSKEEFEKLHAEFIKEAQQRASAQILSALDQMNISLKTRRQYLRAITQVAKAGDYAYAVKRLEKELRESRKERVPGKPVIRFDHKSWSAAQQKLVDALDPYARTRARSARDAKGLHSALTEMFEHPAPPTLGVPKNPNPVFELPLETVMRDLLRPVTRSQVSASKTIGKWNAIKAAEKGLPTAKQGVLEAFGGNNALAGIGKPKKKKNGRC